MANVAIFSVTVLCCLAGVKMVLHVRNIVLKRSSVPLENSMEVTAPGNLGLKIL